MYRYRTDPKIFYDITYKIREMDLAFGIILDQSGSMSGEGIANGMVSLIMLHHVLAALRINHAVIGHTSNRFNNVIIKKYVSFNEDPAHTMEVPYMLSNLRAYSGNCDSGALNYMEQYIKRVRNKDKIVIIFSDGEPTECSESDLVAQVRKMEREGIHVIGLGVDFDNIKHYYPDHANGRNLAEMVNILVDVLKRYVLEKHS
jgi:nitric oxide reductase activation protein